MKTLNKKIIPFDSIPSFTTINETWKGLQSQHRYENQVVDNFTKWLEEDIIETMKEENSVDIGPLMESNETGELYINCLVEFPDGSTREFNNVLDEIFP